VTGITKGTGKDAQRLFEAVSAQTGFGSGLNFDKVLFGAVGEVTVIWGYRTAVMSPPLGRAWDKRLLVNDTRGTDRRMWRHAVTWIHLTKMLRPSP